MNTWPPRAWAKLSRMFSTNPPVRALIMVMTSIPKAMAPAYGELRCVWRELLRNATFGVNGGSPRAFQGLERRSSHDKCSGVGAGDRAHGHNHHEGEYNRGPRQLRPELGP